MICRYCGYDPYEYADVGIGLVPVAITCCEAGYLAYSDLNWSHNTIVATCKIHEFLDTINTIAAQSQTSLTNLQIGLQF